MQPHLTEARRELKRWITRVMLGTLLPALAFCLVLLWLFHLSLVPPEECPVCASPVENVVARTLRSNTAIALATLALLGGGFVAAVYLLWLPRNRVIARLFKKYEDLLLAGEWVVRKTQTSEVPFADEEKRKAWVNLPIERRLDVWIERLTRELRDGDLSKDFEIWKDLNIAKDFQRAYLERPYPKIPAIHVPGRLRLQFAHRYEPTLELGGDFFDIITPDVNRAGVFVADVMGHGTRSALVTAILRALISELSRQGSNAPFFLSEMNKLYYDLMKSSPEPVFASAFYFVGDTTARIGTFSSAGHPAPFHLHRETGKVTQLDVPQPRGAALGVIPNEIFTGGQIRLTDKDVFVFFTDGVYEVYNVAGEEFGMERMGRVLKEAMYGTLEEILDRLLSDIKRFAGDQPLLDDVCIVGVEVTTRPEAEG